MRGGLKIKIFRYIKFKIKNYVFKIKFNKSVKKGKLLLVDWGDRGVGKTTILVNLAKKLNLPIIVSNNNQARLFNIDYFNGDINCYSCSNIDSLRGKDFPNGVLIEEGIDLKTIREILFMHKIKGGYFYSDLIMKQ